jgi:formate dehydrogenase subunit gamma
MGCEDLVSHLAVRHGVTVDGLDEGSGIRVESVYCLGNCALSPAALLDGEPIGRLDRNRLDAIVAGAQRKMQ